MRTFTMLIAAALMMAVLSGSTEAQFGGIPGIPGLPGGGGGGIPGIPGIPGLPGGGNPGPIDLPSVSVPNIKPPTVNVPNVKVPSFTLPSVDVPKINVPAVELPQIDLPDLNVQLPKDLGVDIPTNISIDIPNIDVEIQIPDVDINDILLPFPGVDLSNVKFDLPRIKLDPLTIDWPNLKGKLNPLDIDWAKVDPSKILTQIDIGKIDWSKLDPSGFDWKKLDPKIDVSKLDPTIIAMAVDPSGSLVTAFQSSKVEESIRVEIQRGQTFLKDRVDTLNASLSAESRSLFNIKNWQRWIENPGNTGLEALKRGEDSLHAEISNASEYVKNQWWYRDLQHKLLKQLIEEPHFVICRGDLPGPPIWYVNGIFTTKYKAKKAGDRIAETLNRRVHVIHNRTSAEAPFHTGLMASGFGNDDLSECVYDRLFPATVIGRLDRLTAALIPFIENSEEKLQGNPTTRQLAHVLYHAKEPVSLVTHSQGCIIARNAFFTMSLLGAESKARNNVAWVAAGLPLNNNEIWPKPMKTTVLDYRDDPVSKLVGLRGGGIEYSVADHDFAKKYADQLKDSQLRP